MLILQFDVCTTWLCARQSRRIVVSEQQPWAPYVCMTDYKLCYRHCVTLVTDALWCLMFTWGRCELALARQGHNSIFRQCSGFD